METSEEFKTLVANINKLEQELLLVDENEKMNAVYESEAGMNIEEHFSRCVNALAARKDALLRELGVEICVQKKLVHGARKELNNAIEVRKKLLETGTYVYQTDARTADHVWKGHMSLPVPQVSVVRIELNLPNSLYESIQDHGKVSLVPDEKLMVQQYESKQAATCNYSVVDNITTFAGSTSGFADGKGEKAKFSIPRGICWNPRDDCLYICDKRNNSVRKLSMQGEVSTFVRGSDSQLAWPQEIVLHHESNTFFVTNEYAHNVVKITSEGKVTIFAGSGKIESKDGLGSSASFCYPTSIAIDQASGNLFVSDCNNHAIRKISPQGEVTTFAGSLTSGYVDGHGTSARFDGPWGLFFDDVHQSLLVCDYDNNRLRRVSLNGEVTTVCSIPRPSFVTTANESILVASDKNKIFRVTSQENSTEVIILQQYDRTNEKTKECKFYSTIGLASHEPSHSCFIASENTICKVAFKL